MTVDNNLYTDIFAGKGIESFSLICKFMHIRDSGEYEMLDPHDTTDSYMVLNISGCSKYGLTKRQPKKKYSPIKGLVLLFLEQNKLNVLLLPKNVDISEVYYMQNSTEVIFWKRQAQAVNRGGYISVFVLLNRYMKKGRR